MLVLTEDGIIAARDYLGRTPIVIGRKEDAYAAASESSAFPNLGYDRVRDIGPGEIVRLRPDSCEVLQGSGQANADMLFPVGVLRFPRKRVRGHKRGGRARGCRTRHEAEKTIPMPTVCAAYPTRESATRWATPKATAYHTVAPCSNTLPTWPRSFTPAASRAATSWQE